MIKLFCRLLTTWLAKGFGLSFLMDISDDIIFLKDTEGYTNDIERIILSDHIEIIVHKK